MGTVTVPERVWPPRCQVQGGGNLAQPQMKRPRAPSCPAPPLPSRLGAHVHFHSCANPGLPQASGEVGLGRGQTLKGLVQHRLRAGTGASALSLIFLGLGPGGNDPEGPGEGPFGDGFRLEDAGHLFVFCFQPRPTPGARWKPGSR